MPTPTSSHLKASESGALSGAGSPRSSSNGSGGGGSIRSSGSSTSLVTASSTLAHNHALHTDGVDDAAAGAAAAAAATGVDYDAFGIRGYLCMRDESVTYHRMRRFFCRFVGVNFYRFPTKEAARVPANALYVGEIVKIEKWDGRGFIHTYRNSFKILFSDGVAFNVDAESEDDLRKWLAYIDTALKANGFCMNKWKTIWRAKSNASFLRDSIATAMANVVGSPTPLLGLLSPGGNEFYEPKSYATLTTPPAFKNHPTCAHPGCGSHFDSTTKRQHHCRSCGNSVCADHSGRFVVLRHYNLNDPVRVCVNCFRVHRFMNFLNAIVQSVCVSSASGNAVLHSKTSCSSTTRRIFSDDDDETDAIESVFADNAVGISDLIQMLHLHRHGSDRAYALIINKLLEFAATTMADFEFFLPQIFHLWLTIDFMTNTTKNVLLFRVIAYASHLHFRLSSLLYWLTRAAIDDACGWGFGQNQLMIPEYLFRKFSICKLLMVNLNMQINPKLWIFEADKDLPATPIQKVMINCLFQRAFALLDGDTVESAQTSASPMGYMSQILTQIAVPKSMVLDPRRLFFRRKYEESLERQVFASQLMLVSELCGLTERLRALPPEKRKQKLVQELEALRIPAKCFFPLGSCDSKLLQLLDVVRREGTVFTTKARAPTLLYFEVEEVVDLAAMLTSTSSAQSTPPTGAPSTPSPPTSMASSEEKKKNSWFQRPRKSSLDDAFGDVTTDGKSVETTKAATTSPKNAIEMATSSAIAQAVELSALSAQQRESLLKRAQSGAEEEDDEEDDDDDEDMCDLHQVNLSEERQLPRTRSGSLFGGKKSVEEIIAACGDAPPPTAPSSPIAQATPESASTPTRYNLMKSFEETSKKFRDQVEKFSKSQLVSMARSMETSVFDAHATNESVVNISPGPSILSGLDIVEWMMTNEFVADREHAIWLSGELLTSGAIQPIKKDDESAAEFDPSEEVFYHIAHEETSSATSTAVASGASSSSSNKPQAQPASKPQSSTPPQSQSHSQMRIDQQTQAHSQFIRHSGSSNSLDELRQAKSPQNSNANALANASRLISPRQSKAIDPSSVASVVGARLSAMTSPRTSEKSVRSERSDVSGRTSQQYLSSAIASSASYANSIYEKFQPDMALSALNSVEKALTQHVVTPHLANYEQLVIDMRVLRQQLELVCEYVGDSRKRRQSAFQSAFGESFEQKRERLRQQSSTHETPSAGWDCAALIVKSHDDLRQEVLCLQLIRQFQDIFMSANLPLRLLPYGIMATSASTGLIEYIKNATSLDGLKKRKGFTTLAAHFKKTYGGVDSAAYKNAMANFVRSMAAYSLVCYILQIKDRHNGNIMIDSDGHVIHIDYGFILGIAPGGRFSLETAPFKLTSEMVEAMGGFESENFRAYVILLIHGFLAVQQHADTLLMMIAIMAQESSCPCFVSQDPRDVLKGVQSRLRLEKNENKVIKHVLKLVVRSHNSYRTRQYDAFQKMTNGILP